MGVKKKKKKRNKSPRPIYALSCGYGSVLRWLKNLGSDISEQSNMTCLNLVRLISDLGRFGYKFDKSLQVQDIALDGH